MRLISTITDTKKENPLEFSYYLKSIGIENRCEEVSQSDKPPFFRIWVIEEDQFERAKAAYAEYQKNPEAPVYGRRLQEVTRLMEAENMKNEAVDEPSEKRKSALSPSPYGFISILMLIAMILIFIWSQLNSEISVAPKIPGVVEAPVLKGITKKLSYDYPKYFELRDQLITLHPKSDIDSGKALSVEAQAVFQEMQKTPFWQGFYERVVKHLKDKEFPLKYSGPLFEKIHQGEIWRIFTPCLLHFNFLHIFFNVLWFIMLGNQIEHRIKSGRYLLLIIATAIIPNTAQYLMSGSFFMGVSGVVVGLAGFVWARQQVAPWEGYLLNRMTLGFLGFFVVGIFLLQIFLFIVQLFTQLHLEIAIANTAHLMGGIVGYCLGRLSFFSLRRSN